MVIVPDVKQAVAFVAVIKKTSIHNKKLFDVIVTKCKLAKVTNKMMYAVIEEGVSLGVLKDMPWKRIVYFINKSDIPKIMNFIDDEISGGALYT